jgi:hypothetical protein
MFAKVVTSLAFAGSLTMLAALSSTPAQATTQYGHGASVASSWSPVRNVRWSEHYSRVVASNPSFRRSRMRVECGPITDPVLRQQCIDSFQQEVQAWNDGQLPAMYRTALNELTTGSGGYGSSTPPLSYPTTAGQ